MPHQDLGEVEEFFLSFTKTMALQDILNKILDDATASAKALTQEAEKRATEIADAGQTTLASEAETLEKQGQQKKEALHKKVENMVDHQRKSKTLTTKREVLDQVFTEAIKALKDLDRQEKKQILTKMLDHVHATEGTLLVSKYDTSTITELAKKKGDFKVEEDSKSIGGFRFIGSTTEQDFRFETLLESELKTNLEKELSHLLFAA